MNVESELKEGEGRNSEKARYELRLFVTGASVNSRRAVINIRDICEKYLGDQYSLEIIDVHQQKSVAEKEQIIALPLLIKYFPLPQKRMIGDMSDTQKVLKGLGISF
jgi:circadian clock protein KaiB